MTDGLIWLCLSVGLATWSFRFLPTKVRLPGMGGHGFVGRLLAATGPAAIATLLVAAVLPEAQPDVHRVLPLLCGVGAVILVYRWRLSVVMATLSGALAYGATVAVLGA